MPKGTLSVSLESSDAFYSIFQNEKLSGNLLRGLVKRAQGEKTFSVVEFRLKRRTTEKIQKELKERIKRHFADEEDRVKKERWLKRFKGTAYVILGGLILTVHDKMYGEGILGILLVPAGWFSIFLGLEHVVADWKMNSLHGALEKLKNAEYTFDKK